MKKLLFSLVIPTFLLLLTSCGGSSLISMSATGNPYEMFVITPKDVWQGVAGDSMRLVFEEEVLWTNQPEPLFDLVNVTPQTLNDVMRRHRNIFIIKTQSKADTVAFAVREDVWTEGQIVFDLSAPSQQAAADYIGENGQTLLDYVSIVERERMTQKIKKYSDKQIREMIKKKFDISMFIPQGYRVANNKIDNFMWLTYELPLSSLGVAIYQFDKPSDSTKLDLVQKRNEAVALIPGPSDGSHMATDTIFTPESKMIEINNQAWVQTSGFWNVKGDFMGGPFINYTTFDVKTSKYIGIDLYVYSPSPRYPKRNYIRQLEALMQTVSF